MDYDQRGSVGVLRLNAPPVNALSFALLEELRNSVRRANADAQVRGLVITGDTRHFSAGADVNLFREITGAADAVLTSRVFQEAFQEVEDSEKPVVAALAGHVTGGALELAMACHFRVCASDSRFSTPEVKLGINPGAGGTQRLPRLIGAGPALKLLLTGESISADEALVAGLVDVVCDGKDLIDQATSLLESDKPVSRTRKRVDKLQDPQANDAAFAQAEKILAGVRPELIAPSRIVEAVRTGLSESFEAGLRKEQDGFVACMETLATQNKIYLFFATRETAQTPALAEVLPARVAKVGVVGMGSMGTGIAHALILAGVPVVALDQSDAVVQKGLHQIRGSIENRVAQKKCTRERADQMLALIRTTTNWSDLADADLVIEAVFEDLAAKRAVIASLERTCRADAIIASNTSTLSLDELADGMKQPGRLVGIHFFNPAHRMPLVEVIHRTATPPAITATAMRFAKAIRKTPVLVRNREGFVVNRMFIPYVKEAFWLLEEGAGARAIDRAMVEFGFPMGPFVLIDMAGLDILALTDRVMSRAFPKHGSLPPVAVRLVKGGHLGQKSGSGVYRYEQGDRRPHDSDATGQIIHDVQVEKGITVRAMTGDEITERLVLRMVNEAFCLMEEGVAQRPSDVDAATVLGLGFPDFRGGVLKYAHDLGLATVQVRLAKLAERCGERFSPDELQRN
ncbi:MAG: 3-hydroxyacyl-CoA dehydrogenase NAD-binding domain-containing protein [Kiritimatiellaeota bacterium]|nr:3-hydroxyacyl-CoA dehydrogenase NAD-binding domain-containing protein [Kiritimatiellota bacterium]